MTNLRAGHVDWYFSYGANMSPKALRRRRVSPITSAPACLSDYGLRFSHAGLFFLEPAFANLEKAPGARVHGVLHQIRRSDLETLDRIEGAEYARIRVEVTGEGIGLVEAYAYLDSNPVQGRRPSRRYLESLREGAEAFDLPDWYCRELAAQPTTHVPVLSELATMLVRPAERLRHAGLRPERVRMKRRARSRAHDEQRTSEAGDRSSLIEKCAAALPLIPIPASSVRVETEMGPQGFHRELRRLLRSARRRVVLASLYLGTGPYEQQLIGDLRTAIESSAELRVTIVVDHSRGLRPTANGDTTTSLAGLLRDYPERVELFLYKMPQLTGARSLLPSPLGECIAVSHFKCLVFDDTAIVTGANLSEEYFTCRQARFLFVRDARFVDFSAQVVAATAQASVQVCLSARGMEFRPPEQGHDALVRRVQALVPSPGTYERDESNTYWAPVFQHPALALRQEEELLTSLLAWGRGELSIATPYPNFPASYLRSLRARLQEVCSGTTEILSPSERSHSFTTGRGLKAIVPSIYLRRELDMQLALARSRASVTYRRYEKEGWVFHGKGVWLTQGQEVATVIGSSSFGARSVSRDYDLSCLLVTSEANLREQLASELAFLRELSPITKANSRRAGVLAAILAPLAKPYM